MGIYIKDIDTPKSCGECDDMFLLSAIGCDCCEFGLNERPTDCPLTEVSEPHGRLIDADKALDELFRDKREAYTKHSVWLMFSIYGAPTVIERSET